jgi:lysophospholipase L1-like esterase
MSYSATVLADTPVAYWRLGESSGNFADSSGSGHTATAVGSPTYEVTGLIAGDPNGAVSLPGDTGGAASGSADFNMGTGDFTVEAWIKTTSAGFSNLNLFLHTGNGFVGIDGGKLVLDMAVAANYVGDTTVNDGGIHYVVFMKRSGQIRLYVDGILDNVPTSDSNTFGSSSNSINVGYYMSLGYAGTLDELAIYKGVGLSDARITAHYQAGVAALAAGTASFVSATNAAVSMTCTAASFGVDPYHYQWYRSTVSGFTPGSGNLLSGATSLSLTDSSALSQSTIYHYKLVVTDSETPTPATATSNQAVGVTLGAPLHIGFIGDSITDGFDVTTKPGTLAAAQVQLMTGRYTTATNQGVDGTQTGSWISGSTDLNTAKAAFAAAGVTIVCIMLGTNDSYGNSAATYQSNLTSCVNDLVGAGYTVILNYPPGYKPDITNPYDEVALGRLETYPTAIAALVNGSTILQGDKMALPYFAERTDLLQSGDGIHMTDTGNPTLAQFWATAIAEILLGGGGAGGTVYFAY